MDKHKKCACKGVRTCLLCETQDKAAAATHFDDSSILFYQCHRCGKLLKEEHATPDLEATPLFACGAQHSCEGEKKIIAARLEASELDKRWCGGVFEGVTVVKNFISAEEEGEIVKEIDSHQWAESQSGRRKQVSIGHAQFAKVLSIIMYHCTAGLWAKSEFQASKGEDRFVQWPPSVQQMDRQTNARQRGVFERHHSG